MSRRSLTPLAGLATIAALVLLLPAPALAQTTQVVEYYHTDVLGSVRAVTNQQGQVIRRHDFRPFGEELQPTVPPPDKPLFTGKERDAETGLDYFGARYQRAGVGRFTTVDPLMTIDENLVDPQRWNRYAYAGNNPLKYTDPDGRNPILVAAIIAAGVALLTTPAPANAPGPRDPIYKGDSSGGDVIANVAANLGIEMAVAKVAGAAGRLWTSLTGRAANGADDVLNGIRLQKQLASEAQMGEAGTVMAGGRSGTVFRDAERFAKTYGGKADEWVKKTTNSFRAKDGNLFETHWVENLRTHQRVEFKTKIVQAP